MPEAQSFDFRNQTVLPPDTTKSITNIRVLLPKILGSILGVTLFLSIAAIVLFFRRRKIEAWWESRSKCKSSDKHIEAEPHVPGLPSSSKFEDIELGQLSPRIPTPAHPWLSTDRFSWLSIIGNTDKRKLTADLRVSALCDELKADEARNSGNFGGFAVRKMISDASLRSLHDEHQKKADRTSVPLDQITETDEAGRKASDASVDTIDGLDDHVQNDEVSAFNYKMNQERWLGKRN
jgi:hypothetical protein